MAVPPGAVDRSVTVWLVFGRSSHSFVGVFALSESDRRRQTRRHVAADRRRSTQRGIRADVGAVVLFPEAVFQWRGSSALEGGEAADALRPGDLGLSLEPCRTSGAPRFEGSGLPWHQAPRGLADLDASGSS